MKPRTYDPYAATPSDPPSKCHHQPHAQPAARHTADSRVVALRRWTMPSSARWKNLSHASPLRCETHRSSSASAGGVRHRLRPFRAGDCDGHPSDRRPTTTRGVYARTGHGDLHWPLNHCDECRDRWPVRRQASCWCVHGYRPEPPILLGRSSPDVLRGKPDRGCRRDDCSSDRHLPCGLIGRWSPERACAEYGAPSRTLYPPLPASLCPRLAVFPLQDLDLVAADGDSSTRLVRTGVTFWSPAPDAPRHLSNVHRIGGPVPPFMVTNIWDLQPLSEHLVVGNVTAVYERFPY